MEGTGENQSNFTSGLHSFSGQVQVVSLYFAMSLS